MYYNPWLSVVIMTIEDVKYPYEKVYGGSVKGYIQGFSIDKLMGII